MLDAYHRQYGLKCAYLIPANLYGPGDHFGLELGHVIPAMIRKFVECKSGGTVKLWGTGKPTRDFLYVEDCADAIIRAAERIDDPSPINLGTGVETSMTQLAIEVEYLVSGRKPDYWVDNPPMERNDYRLWVGDSSKPDGQMRRVLDTSKAKEMLGWEATTDLASGLEKTVAWYKANRAQLAGAVNG